MPRSLDIVARAVRPSAAAAPSRESLALASRPGSSARARFAPGAAGDAEFAAHLCELSARIAAGETNRASELHRIGPSVRRGQLFRNGVRIAWRDLRTLSCAGCSRVLLGPSEEPAVRDRARERGLQSLAHLPPPVAGRVHDRPVCARCLGAAAVETM